MQVVGLFEVVQIDVEDGGGVGVPAGTGDGLLQRGNGRSPVDKVGQGVMGRFIGQALLEMMAVLYGAGQHPDRVLQRGPQLARQRRQEDLVIEIAGGQRLRLGLQEPQVGHQGVEGVCDHYRLGRARGHQAVDLQIATDHQTSGVSQASQGSRDRLCHEHGHHKPDRRAQRHQHHPEFVALVVGIGERCGGDQHGRAGLGDDVGDHAPVGRDPLEGADHGGEADAGRRLVDLAGHEGQRHALLPVDQELVVLADGRIGLESPPRPGHARDPGLGELLARLPKQGVVLCQADRGLLMGS